MKTRLVPAPSVEAALRREFAKLCRYTDSGFGELLDSIATKEGIAEEQILLGEILEPLGTHLSLQGGPGGEFIYSDPGYPALIDAAAAVGGVGIPVPLNRDMQNDLPTIASKVNQRTRAVFLVNPHNPTGTVTDARELKSFVRALSDRTLVIVDEAYLEFADSYAQRTLAHLVSGGHNAIVFRTFAKAYGLAGLDIGVRVGSQSHCANAHEARAEQPASIQPIGGGRRRGKPQRRELCITRQRQGRSRTRHLVPTPAGITSQHHRIVRQLRFFSRRECRTSILRRRF
jgi:histidinol-phosphate/aromatic aminotransferase/cobyric acid decarboxylase-like protein